MTILTQEEKKQYARQLLLSEIGEQGQQLLKQAKVLVVGAGGLGSPVLQYLGAAGVGQLGILDGDKVSESNLQRQILYSADQIGQSKADLAVVRLQQNNPYISPVAYNEFLTVDNALQLIQNYDLVVDCTDNFATRYLINDATAILSKPWVYGSISGFTGQVSVFNYKGGATYRCLYPKKIEQPTKAENYGVLGTIAAWVGAIQANEAIKIICKVGSILSGKLLMIDALEHSQSIFSFEKSKQYLVKTLLKTY